MNTKITFLNLVIIVIFTFIGRAETISTPPIKTTSPRGADGTANEAGLLNVREKPVMDPTTTLTFEDNSLDAARSQIRTTSIPFNTMVAEPYRPLYHFTPQKNWMNDPNGMVWHDGEWHLFYQYNPFGDKWGHMSWGHAVSRNLLRWEHLPLALKEENEIMIFSGSAVMDTMNTSGFGQQGKPPIVAIYTAHTDKNQSQALAYSNDRGRSWTKYTNNPVLDIGAKDFRDPKVIWHEPTQRWIMAVAWSLERKVRFYASPDLKQWTHLSDFGPVGSVRGIWECPDLFPLKVEGSDVSKWVLIVNVGSGASAGGSGGQYFVGDFDGRAFTPHEASAPKGTSAVEPSGKIIADFENGYGDWKMTGNCFGDRPANGSFEGQQPVLGFKGSGLVNSFVKGDAGNGTLTSPEIAVEHDWINFLIGGGAQPEKTCVNLKVDGQTVQSATGQDSESLAWISWNVSLYRGKHVKIEIVDAATDGWGHVNADHFVQSDNPAQPAREAALWLDYGPDFYAGVTWSGGPPGDDRRILLGWMSNWQYANDVPTTPWRSTMSIPRELALRRTGDAFRLIQKPVREMAGFPCAVKTFPGGSLSEANAWLVKEKITTDTMDLTLTLSPDSAGQCSLMVFSSDESTAIGISADLIRRTLLLDRTIHNQMKFHPTFARTATGPLPPGDATAPLTLRILIDACSVEVFTYDGTLAVTSLVFPHRDARALRINTAAKVGPMSVRVLARSAE